MKATQIRQAFLDFFKSNDHQVVKSGPLVPHNDPTLMFANAGMVQFKDVFTGKERRAYQRACSSQKCIRISGKHNDLENVGVTARHHTFFEMLGNFSFGDYFKEAAIDYAWRFVTQELGLDRERLMVSVFEGDANAPADDQAADLWRRISGLPEARIARLGASENFWQMGDTGPCGPCTEIHYYFGPGKPDPAVFGQEPNLAGEGWVELWNIVFMQFERQADGRLVDLPAPSIDTGAGLERIAAACQGVTSNYDSDLLRPLVEFVAELADKPYRASVAAEDTSMRVIADHARASAFLLAEGIFPDRDGRSYVLRRIIRRAIRHGHQLGLNENFFHKCVLKTVDLMQDAYPDLNERRALLEEITQQEETRFRRTLKRGLELLEGFDGWESQDKSRRVLPGQFAFLLYDTYGFPLDLQDVIGREQGFAIDEAGFHGELERARAKSAGSKVGDQAVHAAYHALQAKLTTALVFSGYESEVQSTQVVALLRNGEQVVALELGQEGEVVLAQTPFYAEAGGQVGDTGSVQAQEGSFEVSDTQKPLDGLIVHRGRVTQGRLSVGANVEAQVDHERREAIRRHHSATHLLHYALRKTLGPQATQKGSRVGPESLRFDYASANPLSDVQVQQIEDYVNEKIWANAPIETEVLSYQQAKQKGAIGLFEEKYGDVVRMLRMTDDSIELCGGTHASRTGDLGYFKLISDHGIAAGVRRIEAVVAQAAHQYLRRTERTLKSIAESMRTTPEQIQEKLTKLLEEQRKLTKDLEQAKRRFATGGTSTEEGVMVNDVYVLGDVFDVGDAKLLRERAEQLRDQRPAAIILLGTATADGRVALVCAVSKSISDRYDARKLIRSAAEKVGGGGGGRADFAQAGGSNPSSLVDAVRTIYVTAKQYP